MKFAKPFKTVVPGDRYARDFFPGEDCPPYIADVARAAGVLVEPAQLEAAQPQPAVAKPATRRKR